MRKKKSSYQKLKEENLNLYRDIRTLVNRPDSIEAIEITAIIKMQSDLEGSVFYGKAKQ